MLKTKRFTSSLGALSCLLTVPAFAQGVSLEASAGSDEAPQATSSADAPEVDTAAPVAEGDVTAEAAPTAAESPDGDGDPILQTTSAEVPASEAPLATVPETPYIKRYVPEAFMWELGLFGGVMFPSGNHQLYDPNSPFADRQPFKTAGEVGVRVAFFPLSFLGVEAEAAALPSELEDGSSAGLWALRGHGILQLPGHSITPFLLAGGGVLGASSNAMGSDGDEAFHFGGGIKAALDAHLLVRLDVRNTMTRASGVSGVNDAHHPEILLGFSFVPHRSKPDADGDGFVDYRDECPTQPGAFNGCLEPDADDDGVADAVDECPDVAGVEPTGCPDQDGDGLLDRDDPCPDLAGPLPSGCPEKECPVVDSDGDGLVDSADQCPNEAAKTLTGCVIHDQDEDGIPDAEDKCPTEPETKNGFEDADGCPDVIPEKVSKFTGVIKGIEFDLGSAKIQKGSEPLLREAAEVLKSYPDLKVLITGHTDNQGDREANVKLSAERAESVKSFLVQEGAREEQVKTRGAGPDVPLAENGSWAGRQKNRRIEFSIVED